MIALLLNFVGGAAFRMIWGEAVAWLNKKQDHEQELSMARLQSELEAARHSRDLERIRLQSDLSVKEVTVMGDVAVAKAETEAFVEAMRNANKPTGIRWVDAWNGTIRPAAATIALLLWVMKLVQAGFVLVAWDEQLIGAVLGFFFADRSLGKRGK